MVTENLLREEDLDYSLFEKILHALAAIDLATPDDEDVDYKPLYCELYKGISLILENTNNYDQMATALKQLQCKAEDAYVSLG